VAAVVALVAVLGVVVPRLTAGDTLRGLSTDSVTLGLGELAQERIERALEVYRLRKNRYPDTLQALVDEGLLARWELRQPFERTFAYARSGDGYRISRPFY
jgi:hypothetical protein